MKLRDAVATLWVKNVMMRHGIPPGDPNVVDSPSTAAPATKSPLWPAIVSAALTAAGLPIAGAALNWFYRGEQQPAAVAPADSTPQHDGSLYQFLEDHDLHLPQ